MVADARSVTVNESMKKNLNGSLNVTFTGSPISTVDGVLPG
jgi:hypothetical protein